MILCPSKLLKSPMFIIVCIGHMSPVYCLLVLPLCLMLWLLLPCKLVPNCCNKCDICAMRYDGRQPKCTLAVHASLTVFFFGQHFQIHMQFSIQCSAADLQCPRSIPVRFIRSILCFSFICLWLFSTGISLLSLYLNWNISFRNCYRWHHFESV